MRFPLIILTSLVFLASIFGTAVLPVHAEAPVDTHDMSSHDMHADCDGGDCGVVDLDCLEHCLQQLDLAEPQAQVLQSAEEVLVEPATDLPTPVLEFEIQAPNAFDDVFFERQILTTQKRE